MTGHTAWQKAKETPEDAEQRELTRREIFDRINALQAAPPTSQRDAEIRVWEEVQANLGLQRTVDKLRLRIQVQAEVIRDQQATLSRRNKSIESLKFALAAARRAIPGYGKATP